MSHAPPVGVKSTLCWTKASWGTSTFSFTQPVSKKPTISAAPVKWLKGETLNSSGSKTQIIGASLDFFPVLSFLFFSKKQQQKKPFTIGVTGNSADVIIVIIIKYESWRASDTKPLLLYI